MSSEKDILLFTDYCDKYHMPQIDRRSGKASREVLDSILGGDIFRNKQSL